MRTTVIFCSFLCLSVICLPYAAYAQREDKTYGTNLQNDSRKGTVHVWTDPATGDRVTSVRPGRKDTTTNPSYTTPNMPIYVLPQITPQTPVAPRPQPRVQMQSLPQNEQGTPQIILRFTKDFTLKWV